MMHPRAAEFIRSLGLPLPDGEVALAETMPRLEGNQMHTILSRRPQGGGRAKVAVKN